MLSELNIKNFAIIDQLTISFSRGLTILSGETGTGKSIIIGALNLLLGGRASTDLIRSAEEEATVEAIFDTSHSPSVAQRLKDWGMEVEDTLLLRRTITRSSKGKVFIGNHLATVNMLSNLGEELITISGQHEHQLLLKPDQHLEIVDAFGGLMPLRNTYASHFHQLLSLTRELNTLIQVKERREERIELLQFQIKEITEANLRPGEEEKLREERRILNSSEKLFHSTKKAYETIYADRGSVLEQLKSSLRELKELSQIDARLSPLFSTLESSVFQIEDLALSLRDYSQKIEFDPKRLEEIESRLAEINTLKKKYGETIEKVLSSRDRAERELKELTESEEKIEELKGAQEKLKIETLNRARQLSQERGKVKTLLKEKMEKELSSLSMKKTIFEVKAGSTPAKGEGRENFLIDNHSLYEKGMDDLEFLISPNPGEELRPLSRIASGGELSRIILAIKRIIAQEEEVSTLIFDEVDAGIGGATAEVVGKKLKEISRKHQVLCITHLPQIACFADIHYSIAKEMRKGRTVTFLKRLEGEERVEELSRMLGGREITIKTREHAREMLSAAQGVS
jgi:DNA repair protein RecN (Recombination protein N)